jgi:hypothetical protein
MSVELRNLQSGETFAVGPDGVIIGRQGGGAAIQVDDRSVSKKHARVFSDGVEWFLEDMGSVNGTVVQGNKIGGAIPLEPGLVFSLSKHKFEVVNVPGRAGPVAAPPEQETRTGMRQSSQNLPSDLRKDPIPRKRNRPVDDDIAPMPPENTNRGGGLPLASDQDFPSGTLNSVGGNSLEAADGDRPHLGIDDYEPLTPGEAISMGIGYALKTTPLLAFNPLGTVRSHIAEPPLPGLEKVPLAVVMLPALAVLITVQAGAGAVAAAILGQLSVVDIVLAPVKGVIGGAIGAVIMGFVSHPVLRWFVTKFGGQSDARARTGHIAMGIATALVLLVPQTLSTILTAVIAKLTSVSSAFALLMIIPALIALVATPLPLFVQWSWWKSYGVAKWVQTVFLVLMVLSVLGGVYTCITTIAGAVGTMRGGGLPTPDVVVGPDGVPVPVPVPPTGTETPPPDPDGQPPPPAPVPAPGTPPPPPAPLGTPPPPPAPPPAVNTVSTPVKVDDGYAAYAAKRVEAEALMERDPTVVSKRAVRTAYETFLECEDRAENEVFNEFDKRKRPSWKNPLYEKAKKARVYADCRTQMDALHKRIFGG